MLLIHLHEARDNNALIGEVELELWKIGNRRGTGTEGRGDVGERGRERLIM